MQTLTPVNREVATIESDRPPADKMLYKYRLPCRSMGTSTSTSVTWRQAILRAPDLLRMSLFVTQKH